MSTAEDKLVRAITTRRDSLKQARGNFETMWDDVCKYVLSSRQRDKSPGAKRYQYLYSAVPTRAANRLMSALNSMLTSSSLKWIRGRPGEAYGDSQEIREWCDNTANIIQDRIDASNFSLKVQEFYLDYGTIGTAVMYMDENFWFDTLPIWECCIDEAVDGTVDTMLRSFSMTARQAVSMFEDTVGEKIKRANDKEPDRKFDFIHAVYPFKDIPATKEIVDLSDVRPFASIWVSVEDKKIVRSGGFYEFPFFVPRWMKCSGEVYGRSPATEAMPDIRVLHAMAKSNLRAQGIITDPPLDVPENSYLTPINTSSGALNFRTPNSNDKISVMYNLTQLPVSLEMEQAKERSVKESFFYEQLNLKDSDRMTATEVTQRIQENARVLGPAYETTVKGFLVPLVKRAYGILSREIDSPAAIAPPPQGMSGDPFVFESPLARAQRMGELIAINESLTVAAPIIQMSPQSADVIDFDAAVRKTMQLGGVDSKMIRSRKDVDAIRSERQQSQQMAALAEMAPQVANAAKAASQADPGAGLLGALGGR